MTLITERLRLRAWRERDAGRLYVYASAPEVGPIAGVPARVIRQIDEDDRMNVWETYLKNEKPLSVRKKRG